MRIPGNAGSETRQFTRYWFDDYARRQLASLAMAIERTHDSTIREALWCAFSRLIITKQSGASLAMDLSHSRPHRKFKRAPAKPFRKFLTAVDRVITNCIDVTIRTRGPDAKVYEGDARHLDLQDRSIDLIITSPPYLNAIDYLRCSKFSLVWMGYSVSHLRRLRSTTVGTEVGMDPREDQENPRNPVRTEDATEATGETGGHTRSVYQRHAARCRRKLPEFSLAMGGRYTWLARIPYAVRSSAMR